MNGMARAFCGVIIPVIVLAAFFPGALRAQEKGPHKTFGIECTHCHTTDAWNVLKKEVEFDHKLTGFTLLGKHADVACGACHGKIPLANLEQACISCHADQHRGEFGDRCQDCHNPAGWRSPAQQIARHQQSLFPLLGQHANVECRGCHVNQQEREYVNTPTDCFSCHQTLYTQTKNPDHAGNAFDRNCLLCHTMNGWTAGTFDHNQTKFPLTGMHQRTECARCHAGGRYTNTPLECQGCHEQNYRNTTQPNHLLVGFTMQCQDCHSTLAWQPVARMPLSIDHDKTRFPLQGAHRSLVCEGCHVNLVFRGTPTDCFICHKNDYNGAKNPDHAAGQYDRLCTVCHSMNGWKPANVDHDKTRFPLRDIHAVTPCEKCHVNGRYAGTPTDCYSCHQSDFARVANPAHVAGNFDHDCTKCHTTKGWKPATFDHNATRFPLTDGHANRQCADCHINGNYRNMSIECYGCHQADYARVAQPNHVTGQFDHDCTTCHSTKGWKPASFDHAKTLFPLTGVHAQTACEKCHVNGRYKNLATDCYSCHTADFARVAAPNHQTNQFPRDCASCHSTAAWKPSTFDHSRTLFPLLGAHASRECRDCHKGGNYGALAGDCWSCHQSDFAQVKNPDHQLAQLDHDCTLCHTTAGWKPSSFNHATTKFPLTGRHQTTPCADCHLNGNYKLLYTDCYSCHQKDFTQVQAPNHAQGMFDHDCASCHGTTAWKPATFSHATTKFPLTGKHLTTDCIRCHVNGNYKLVYADCYSCHQADYRTPKEPDHALGNLDHDCMKCHTTAAWKPSTFDHAATRFPLAGAHKTALCSKCHVNGNYALQYTDCYQCHQADFQQGKNPDHAAGRFDHDCTKCHGLTAWKPSTFDHAATKFPLAGAHRTTDCARCHVNGNYNLQYTDCWQCHETDYRNSLQPNHMQAGIDHDCAKCHGTAAWKPATFDHATTKFPLTGSHVATPCEKCHVNGNYNLQYADCYQCHQDKYSTVQQPNHVAGHFDHDCARCHGTAAWKPAVFDHATTKFPLTGAHLTTPCEQCHVNGNYNLQYADCYQCHQSKYASVAQPNHQAGKFDHDCTKCHSTTAWKPAQFNHATTNFPLTGAHLTTACEQCHVNGNYSLQYTDCYQCHQARYASVTQPNHVSGKFDHDCTKCHSTTAWKPAQFNHSSTNFPLTGAHLTTQCERCHVNGNYNLTYSNCFACHQTDYQQAVNPNHASGKFPQDCTVCHSTTAWRPSSFNHASTPFPLTGKHLTTPCEQCHANGNYTLQYTDCYQCHQSNFNQAQNPNHVSGMLPHTCATCHTTLAWKPSTFSHSATNFPLQGGHLSVPCQNCHLNGNYSLTYVNCWQCHETTFNQAQNPNHVSNQFPHDCATCHSQTAWKPSTFNHSTTNFPLAGAHIPLPCAQCHTGGNYQLVYQNCWQCHQANYSGAQNPNHVSNQFPHDCLQCHNQVAYKPSTFNHGSTAFPLAGAHLSVPCIQCHVGGNYALAYQNCWQCHQTAYNNAQNPNHVSNQIPHDCTTCHNQTAWKPSTFNHGATSFPLVGAHINVNCIQCHTGGNYSLTYVNCWQCHESTFNGAQNPNHVSNQFPHDCLTCHNQVAWKPSTFNHGSTNFPLVGAHVSQPCSQCHVNGNYQLVYTECYQCHQSDFNGATNPNHVSNQFSHNCTTCHSQTAWTPSTFNHGSTNFPLAGAHTTLQCSQCHVNGNYQLVYTNCYQCHSANFNGATTPANHVAMALDHMCTSCHNQSSWNPATVFRTFHNQNYPTAFPVYSGSKHSYPSIWSTCVQCHTSNNKADYCCTSACHTNSSNLASQHSAVSGYSYGCKTCTTCHPNGRAP